MPNLTSGAALHPYGQGGRNVTLPVKATTQLWMSGMVAELGGALVPATTAGSGRVIGCSNYDALGGESDGTIRASIFTDLIFEMSAGVNAPTDATPFGTPLYAETDNTVGTAASGFFAGLFMGIEDSGLVRVFIGVLADEVYAVTGAALTDTATQTVQRLGKITRYLMPAVFSQNSTVTLGTTGALAGDVIKILSPGTTAHTLAVSNGGGAAGTLDTIGSAHTGYVQAQFDGTNWIYDGSQT